MRWKLWSLSVNADNHVVLFRYIFRLRNTAINQMVVCHTQGSLSGLHIGFLQLRKVSRYQLYHTGWISSSPSRFLTANWNTYLYMILVEDSSRFVLDRSNDCIVIWWLYVPFFPYSISNSTYCQSHRDSELACSVFFRALIITSCPEFRLSLFQTPIISFPISARHLCSPQLFDHDWGPMPRNPNRVNRTLTLVSASDIRSSSQPVGM